MSRTPVSPLGTSPALVQVVEAVSELGGLNSGRPRGNGDTLHSPPQIPWGRPGFSDRQAHTDPLWAFCAVCVEASDRLLTADYARLR